MFGRVGIEGAVLKSINGTDSIAAFWHRNGESLLSVQQGRWMCI